jgi:hypothetical protein
MCMRVRSCNLTYPASKAYAPYCTMPSLAPPYFLAFINDTIFGKNFVKVESVLIISTAFYLKYFSLLEEFGEILS